MSSVHNFWYGSTMDITNFIGMSTFPVQDTSKNSVFKTVDKIAYTGYYSAAAPRETSALGEVVHEQYCIVSITAAIST